MFSGFSDLAYQIENAAGEEALREAVKDALTQTSEFVQRQVDKAALPYAEKGGGREGFATGDMYRARKQDNNVVWLNSYVAEVSVGFELYKKGGWHSIFVMYGTPRYPKDSKLYNAIKGNMTQNAIAIAQEKIMREHLALSK
jgi:hypothetical protein